MTYEEAIKLLYSVTVYYGSKCPRTAIDLAIKALGKQIPKKPREAKCQFCNHYIPVVVRDRKMRFCPFCGQKIDWEDNE